MNVSRYASRMPVFLCLREPECQTKRIDTVFIRDRMSAVIRKALSYEK